MLISTFYKFISIVSAVWSRSVCCCCVRACACVCECEWNCGKETEREERGSGWRKREQEREEGGCCCQGKYMGRDNQSHREKWREWRETETLLPVLIYSDQEYFCVSVVAWVQKLRLSQLLAPFCSQSFPQQRWPGVEEKKGSRAQRCPLSPDTCCWLAAEMEDTVWLCLRTNVCGCVCVCPACKWVTDHERRNFSLTPLFFPADEGGSASWGPLSICLWPSKREGYKPILSGS